MYKVAIGNRTDDQQRALPQVTICISDQLVKKSNPPISYDVMQKMHRDQGI
jgi:hypothetical protein